MIALGVQDGIAKVNAGDQETENLSHYYALKKKHDKRVKGVTYKQFKEMKAEGAFGQEYKLLEDKKFQNLFLQ